MVLVYLAASVASYILGMILAAGLAAGLISGLAQAAGLVQWAITGAGMGFLLGKNRDSLQAQCKVCLTQTLVLLIASREDVHRQSLPSVVVTVLQSCAPSDGVAAKNILAGPLSSPPSSAPVDMDPTNFTPHFCCLTHPCALCEEARVVKVSLLKHSSVMIVVLAGRCRPCVDLTALCWLFPRPTPTTRSRCSRKDVAVSGW